MSKQRTSQQNKSLHKGLQEVADRLQEQGIERKTIMEDLVGYEAPITMEFLKEIYKTIIFTMYGHTSTAQLEKKQVTDSWDVFNKFMGENYGVHCPWPSIEEQMFNQITE